MKFLIFVMCLSLANGYGIIQPVLFFCRYILHFFR
uniref:Truncated ORF7b n=1 Tax=Canine coronavirus TaxID=11153 RepID=A0A8E6FM79_9ALPC|nr:truncated ORF7b [Canine coronavirus]